jgi:transcriptional regulator with XRE-family HTH domain
MVYERYAKLRDSKGLSDYKVAKESGVNPAIIYSWKVGRWSPGLGSLQKLSKYFGVSIEYFEGGEDA